MTHKQKVLRLLADGKPHTHHELYALGCVAHSRVADLRRDGHNIVCWKANDRGESVSVYQLLGALDAPEPVTGPQPGGSGASSAPNLLAQDPRDEGALDIHPHQLTLEKA